MKVEGREGGRDETERAKERRVGDEKERKKKSKELGRQT